MSSSRSTDQFPAAAAIPDATLEIVPGGHAPRLRSSDAVGAATSRFLRRHVAAARHSDAAVNAD